MSPGATLPIASDLESPPVNLVIVDNLLAVPFLDSASPAIALPQSRGYQSRWLDNQYLGTLPTDQPMLLQLFIRGNPFRGSAGSTDLALNCLGELLGKGNLLGVVLYGSPYAWEQITAQLASAQLPESIPAVFSYGQMGAAQAIALKAIFDGATLANPNPDFRRKTEISTQNQAFTD